MSMTQQVQQIPATPAKVGEYNAAMDGATRKGEGWWEGQVEGPQVVKVDLDAALPVDKKGKPKKLRAKRGPVLVTFAIILRILGFAAGFAMCALGGWILYKIALAKTASQMVQYAAFGVFLLLCGLLTVLVETRTKRTMKGCLSTYVIVSSYLSRGFFYLAIGALTFAIKNFAYPPPYVQITWVAGGIIAIGGLNLIFYPFYWGFQRKDQVIKSNPPKIAHAEEVVYDMQIYDPEKKRIAMEEKNKEIDTKLFNNNPNHVSIPIPAENAAH